MLSAPVKERRASPAMVVDLTTRRVLFLYLTDVARGFNPRDLDDRSLSLSPLLSLSRKRRFFQEGSDLAGNSTDDDDATSCSSRGHERTERCHFAPRYPGSMIGKGGGKEKGERRRDNEREERDGGERERAYTHVAATCAKETCANGRCEGET